jgi:hypothetical protein
VRARRVPQARKYAGPVVVLAAVLMTVVVMTIVVLVTVVVAGARAAHAVHDIQDVRGNALPHINKYQWRAFAK